MSRLKHMPIDLRHSMYYECVLCRCHELLPNLQVLALGYSQPGPGELWIRDEHMQKLLTASTENADAVAQAASAQAAEDKAVELAAKQEIVAKRNAEQTMTPPKWQENDLVSGGHWPAWPSWELAWTMNWMDWLCTSADNRMWSGRRAVVIRTGRRAELLGVKLSCLRSRCHASVSDVLCVRSYVHFVCVCVFMCMCVCVRT